jgi:hypothetical protein
MNTPRNVMLDDLLRVGLMSLAQQPAMPPEQVAMLREAALEFLSLCRVELDAGTGSLLIYMACEGGRYERLPDDTAHALLALLTACGVDVAALCAGEAG